MVSLGVGRGGSVAQAFQEGEQQALSGRMSRQQMQIAAAEEARRAQEFDWSGQDRARVASTAGIGLPESTGGGFGGFGGAAPASPPTSGAPAPGAPLSRPGLSFGAPPSNTGRRSAALRFPSLVRTESGGRFGASNDARGAGGARGHFGRVQFGVARLNEAKAAGVIPRDMTPQQFLQSPEVQEAAEEWHFDDIERFMAANELTKYVGSRVNGVPVTYNGLVAVAHLGGKAGLRKFLESGGKYNPADVNGTSLTDYLRTHASAEGLLQQAPDRMFMQSDSMQTRAGLAEPYMLGRRVRQTPAPEPEPEPAPIDPITAFTEDFTGMLGPQMRQTPAPVDPITAFSEDFTGTYNSDQGAYDYRTNPLLRGVFGDAALQRIPSRPEVTVGPSVAPAGLQVPAELQVDESAVRPRARPREDMRPTLEELETQGDVTEDRVAPPPSVAQRPAGTYSMGDGTEFTIPSAGLRSDDPATSDIRRGGTASTVSPDLGAMRALFTDAPALALSRQQLALEEESLRQQYRIAQGSQNFAAMAQITGAFAVVQARQRAANYMEAGILAQQGNFDPLSQALSEMNGSSVRVTPIDGNTVRVESAAGVKQVPVSEMLSLYRQAVDEGYQQQLAAQAAEEAAERAEVRKAQLEVWKDEWGQIFRGTSAQALEQFKADLGRDPAYSFQTVESDSGKVLVVFADAMPVGAYSFGPSPRDPKTTVVQSVPIPGR
jgi:hypothetical protein